MRPFVTALLVASSACCVAEGARAADASAPPRARPEDQPAEAPWQGGDVGAPGATPPKPLLETPGFARNTIELIPQLGLNVPNCRDGSASNARCDGAKGGLGLGFIGLWRISPYFAWGGTLSLHGFRYDPPEELGRNGEQAGAAFLGLLGRVYFLDEGPLDPYVQVGIGGGAIGTAFDDEAAGGDRFEETGAGPALQVGAGFDFHITRRLRLGPSVAFTSIFVDKIRRCTGGGSGNCIDLDKESDGHLNGLFWLGGNLTILLGDEL